MVGVLPDEFAQQLFGGIELAGELQGQRLVDLPADVAGMGGDQAVVGGEGGILVADGGKGLHRFVVEGDLVGFRLERRGKVAGAGGVVAAQVGDAGQLEVHLGRVRHGFQEAAEQPLGIVKLSGGRAFQGVVVLGLDLGLQRGKHRRTPLPIDRRRGRKRKERAKARSSCSLGFFRTQNAICRPAE